MYASHAIPLLIERRAIDADTQLARNERHDAPDTPLFAGIPASSANSPDALYIPHVVMNEVAI